MAFLFNSDAARAAVFRDVFARELPDLPLAYADAGPMLAEPMLYPVDEGYQEPDAPPEPSGAAGGRSRRARRPGGG